MTLQTMNLDDFDGDLARVLLLGQSGTGKTTLAGSIAELGRTLYLYAVGEEGIASLRGEEWSTNIDVVRVKDPTQIVEIHRMLVEGDHEYDALVVDSWSALDRMFRRYLLGLPQDGIRDMDHVDAFMDIRTWGSLADLTMDVMTALYGLASHTMPRPMHVVITSQVQEYEEETDEEFRVGAAVSKGCRTAVHAVPDFILHLTIAEDPDSTELDGGGVHRVILLPDDRKVTKLHTERERHRKMPQAVGTKDARLTMKKFLTMTGVPLSN